MFSTARPVQNLKSGAQVQQQQQHPQQQYSQLAFTEPQHRDAVHQLNGFHQSSYNTTSGLHQPLHQQGSSNIHHLQTIQIPMLSALQVPQPSPPANPPQQPQQQNILGQQGQSIPPPPPQNGQDFTLSSILHFLQIEWRRYERDRNEWEIERAEMRVRCVTVPVLLFDLSSIYWSCFRLASLFWKENVVHSKKPKKIS